MRESDPQPPPDWIKHAYDILSTFVNRHGERITREQAHEVLLTHEEFSDEPADAKYAVKHLLKRGWLYEGEGELRVTDSEPGV